MNIHRATQFASRGAALLIVLATLIILMTVMTIVVRAASTIQLQRQIREDGNAADDLLTASHAPIERWLREDSAKMVAEVESTSPRFIVLNEGWIVAGRECRIQITAFDQFGMVAWTSVRNGTPLRLTLPADALHAIDSLDPPHDHSKCVPGLDRLVRGDGVPGDRRIFPSPQTIDQPAIGELIATHGVVQAGSRSSSETSGASGTSEVSGASGESGKSGGINVNTAPMRLVESALRLAGRGGYEQVLAARIAGKPANLGTLSTTANGANRFTPQIVAMSTCWSFRIDVYVNSLWRSWWAVYEPGQSGKWECVQRLAITE